MKKFIKITIIAIATILVCSAFTQGGPTAVCKDGTYSYSQNHSGTCSHHGGVLYWLD